MINYAVWSGPPLFIIFMLDNVNFINSTLTLTLYQNLMMKDSTWTYEENVKSYETKAEQSQMPHSDHSKHKCSSFCAPNCQYKVPITSQYVEITSIRLQKKWLHHQFSKGGDCDSWHTISWKVWTFLQNQGQPFLWNGKKKTYLQNRVICHGGIIIPQLHVLL